MISMTAQKKRFTVDKNKNGCIGKNMKTVCNYCQNSNYLFQLRGGIVKSSPEKACSELSGSQKGNYNDRNYLETV